MIGLIIDGKISDSFVRIVIHKSRLSVTVARNAEDVEGQVQFSEAALETPVVPSGI